MSKQSKPIEKLLSWNSKINQNFVLLSKFKFQQKTLKKYWKVLATFFFNRPQIKTKNNFFWLDMNSFFLHFTKIYIKNERERCIITTNACNWRFQMQKAFLLNCSTNLCTKSSYFCCRFLWNVKKRMRKKKRCSYQAKRSCFLFWFAGG